MGTDRDWEAWGHDDPYYGVLSNENFRIDALTAESKQAFFLSGEEHVAALLDTIRKTFSPGFRPRRSLDFGCGVGRLLIPLAKHSDHATGIDVSPSMLAEAARNCAEQQVHNVDLIGSDDSLSQAKGEYDLVNSHIVLVHIDSRRGHALIEALADKVGPGGFIAVQVLYSCNAPRWKRAIVKLRYQLPPLNALRNLIRGRPLDEPAMQLHVYNLPTLLRMLHGHGFGEVLMVPDAFENGQFDSVVLIAQRQAREACPMATA
jgi:SAM-dependent methyltransferase